MSDHLPTTEEVREAYQSKDNGLDFKRAFHERGAAFDAWLEAVKDQAWHEGRDVGIDECAGDIADPVSPYAAKED